MSALAYTTASHDGALRLADWSLLRARGSDAATFLQSQLTQDVTGLSQGDARLSGYCSPKGRLLASLIVWGMAPEEFGLLCSTDLAAPLLKRLSMYVLRSRCRLDDAAAECLVHGLVGPSATSWLGDAAPAPGRTMARDGAWAIGLPPVEQTARYLWIQSPQAPEPPLPVLSEAAWQWLEVSAGVPRITAATVEQFVPQMVNLERVGGVDFHKGCYPGQEVVARSQYRGVLKRRMHLFATSGIAQPGQEVFHSDDPSQPAGMVVNAAPERAAGSRVLAEVKIAALESGSLHLGSALGPPLQRLPLPYAMADVAAV
jgi:folate-binding protein YgfZ